jgi:hypothetical protein
MQHNIVTHSCNVYTLLAIPMACCHFNQHGDLRWLMLPASIKLT